MFAQSQLDILLKNDSSLAEQYQDTITEIKLTKEADYDRLKNIHNRFDYFLDEKKMHGKIKSEQYDVQNEYRVTEEEAVTTELSD